MKQSVYGQQDYTNLNTEDGFDHSIRKPVSNKSLGADLVNSTSI